MNERCVTGRSVAVGWGMTDWREGDVRCVVFFRRGTDHAVFALLVAHGELWRALSCLRNALLL